MGAFTRFLVTTAIRILREMFVFGTLGSAVVIILAAIRHSREVLTKQIPGKAEAEWLWRT
jgi:hypothetical protein